MNDKALSESALIALTLKTVRAWAKEETLSNPDAGVSYEQRIAETLESYIDNLKEEGAETA